MITVTRKHEIHCGHRVLGHEGKCKNLHGHSYVIDLTVIAPDLDELGRIVDFSVIKRFFMECVEVMWDHKTLLIESDPLIKVLGREHVTVVPFNPTAENIAKRLCEWANWFFEMESPGVQVFRVVVHETSKCSATYVPNNIVLSATDATNILKGDSNEQQA